MSGRIIYSKRHFNIYKLGRNDYIVHNTHKQFKYGHTHINNYNTAKYILNLTLYSSIPQKKISNYLLNSIVRISKDEPYINKIKKLME